MPLPNAIGTKDAVWTRSVDTMPWADGVSEAWCSQYIGLPSLLVRAVKPSCTAASHIARVILKHRARLRILLIGLLTRASLLLPTYVLPVALLNRGSSFLL
jgi:hypothetical protein